MYGSNPNAQQSAPFLNPPKDGARRAPRAVGWFKNEQPLFFAAPATGVFGDATGVNRRAVWKSPVFDLYPSMGGLSGASIQAVPLTEEYNWHVVVYCRNAVDATTQACDVYTMEGGHPLNADLAAKNWYTVRTSRTQEFFAGPSIATDAAGQESAVALSWVPPIGIRFWRFAVIVDWFDNTAPVLYFSAAAGGSAT